MKIEQSFAPLTFFQIDSFVLDEENCEENSSDSTEDEDEEEIEDSDSDEEEEEDEEEEDSKFLLQNDDPGNSNFPVMDAETQAKIEALFDSAGIRKYDSVHITDPEVSNLRIYSNNELELKPLCDPF